MDSVTDLVGELGEEIRDVVRDVTLVVGSAVPKVDNGRVRVLSVVTGCEFGTNVEDGTPLVCGEVEVLSFPEVNVSNGEKEELLDVVVAPSDIRDRVERSVGEVIVAFLVGVIMVVKKVLVTGGVVEGCSVDVAVVNVLVVMGVGVESTLVSREWGKVEAEGILPVWLVPVLPVERDNEDADVTGRFVANGLEWFPVPEGVAVPLGGGGVEVINGVVSKFWGLERKGTSVVWAVDVIEPSCVGGMSGPWEDRMSVVWDVSASPEELEIETVPGVGVLEVESISEEADGRNVLGGDVTWLVVIEVAMLDVEIVTMLADDAVGVGE